MSNYQEIMEKIRDLPDDFFEKHRKTHVIQEIERRSKSKEAGLNAELKVIAWFFEHNRNNEKHIILYPEVIDFDSKMKKPDLSIHPQHRTIFIEVALFEESDWQKDFDKVCQELQKRLLEKRVSNARIGIKPDCIVEEDTTIGKIANLYLLMLKKVT